MIINKVIKSILESKKIGISFHASPDGDSIGSSLGLMQGLMKLNKEVYILCDDKVPEVYGYLPCIKSIINASSTIKDGTDCIIILDCGSYDRISVNLSEFPKNYYLINVDHHITNELYGDINFVNTRASAVGEIVYNILKELKVKIDENISLCLYTSIVTDTGGFKYSNTTTETHNIIGELIKTGINFSEVHRLIFENKKYERVKLYGSVINSMYLTHKDKICVMKLTSDLLNDFSNKASDTSDIISIGMEIDTVEVAILLKEMSEGVKISLRSKSIVDVRKIAEAFGGGGHTRASGLSIDKNITEVEKIILNAVENELV
ncbi:DHH family phosphoesterase [Candidatus Clostridium stratigraminis]|uniref:Bifunctional oligoribonuclease/PAP phosphatase NrnA n=1 Tax=Candidatus Clostridium stratigraminis TaxID=3381661 RepID=A0ABW8T4D4_9CLOT